MAVVTPFNALRYDLAKAGAPESVCCPPYDIIPESERAFWEGRSPRNMIRLEKPAGEHPYEDAAETLSDWLARGILRRGAAPAFYLYEQSYQTPEGEALTVSGLFATVQLADYSEGIVLPHENTLSKAKDDRYLLARATKTQLSPIYCLYEDPSRRISDVLADERECRPMMDFTMPDGVAHRLWEISEPDKLAAVSASFTDKKLYIADGHHRYETALRLRDEGGSEFVLMLLTDMDCPGLRVFPTHRVAHRSDKLCMDTPEARAQLEQFFDIAPLPERDEPLAAGTLGMVTREASYLLTLRDTEAVRRALPSRAASYCDLDVTMLHALILEPLMGIGAEKMAGGEYLSYTRDKLEAQALVRDGDALCAFLLPPTQVRQIRDVSLDGEKMPQKSTYFYPKILTGMVMYPF